MNRDIRKTVEEYKRRFSGNGKDNSRFVLEDIKEICDMTPDPAERIINATYVGYVVGYKAAERQFAKRMKEGRC